MKRTSLIIVLSILLQGCVFVVGAAAGAAAIALVYDHRTVSTAIHDTRIGNKILHAMSKDPKLRTQSHIGVSVFNGVVLLTGEVPNAEWRARANAIANSVPGVVRVYNQIIVAGPTSTLTRTSDAWITAKIKTQMLATEDLKSSSIKVVTEDGVVYLMGVVTHQQADIAVNIARQVTGVQKVAKIFQYKNG